jgi:hypothetical protein
MPKSTVAISLGLLLVGATARADVKSLDDQARVEAPGAVRVGDLVRAVSSQTDWLAPLQPNSCYLVTARAGGGVKKVVLSLWSPEGKRVATAKSWGPANARIASLRYCSTWRGSFHVQARAEGQGSYVVGTYYVPKTASPPPPLVGAPIASAAPPPAIVPPPVVVQPVYVQPTYVAPTYAPIVYAPAPAQTRTVIVVPAGGAACNSSIDCGSGEFCKEDSTGYKVCMGHGGRGAACSSSIDCGSGMFCKEDSDGYKMCM